LVQETLFVGKQTIELDSVDSTNNYAARLLSKNLLKDGALITAKYQLNGRGQRNNVWQSNASDNLLLSYVFFPNFLEVGKQFLLSCCFANAVAQLIELYLPNRVNIKWPNDIFVDELKISGILIENNLKGSQIVSSIAGIGINVEQKDFQQLDYATSMAILGIKKHNKSTLIMQLNSLIEHHYNQLKSGDYDDILFNYNKLLYRKGLVTNFMKDNQIVQFRVVEVLPDGQLQVSDDKNDLIKLTYGVYRMQ